MGKTIYALVAGAVLAVGLLPALPAQAATGYDRCPATYYCLFSEVNGGGDIALIKGDVTDLGTVSMDNRANSDWNRTTSRIWLNSEVDYQGCAAFSAAGAKGNFAPTFQDFFSSLSFDVQNGGSCGGPRD